MRVTWIWVNPTLNHDPADGGRGAHARSGARRTSWASIEGIPEQTTCHESTDQTTDHPRRTHHV